MTPAFSRREFVRVSGLSLLGMLGGAGISVARAGGPVKRRGAPRLRVSLSAFSFRRFYKDSNRGKKKQADPAQQITLFDFIDYCADHGCDAELTSYYFPPDAGPAEMAKLRRHAFQRGVAVSGSSVGNNFTLTDPAALQEEIAGVKRWIDLSAILGAPHLRVFAGDAKGVNEDQARRLVMASLEECCDYAGARGIMLGLENHHGIVAEPAGLLAIVNAVRSPWLGVNLDTGNFETDDPYRDLATVAPYAVNVQLKVAILRRGMKVEEPTDLGRVVKILRDANYQGYVALEYQDARPWEDVPRWLEKMKTAFAG